MSVVVSSFFAFYNDFRSAETPVTLHRGEQHTNTQHKKRAVEAVDMTEDNYTVGTLPGVGRVLFASREIKVRVCSVIVLAS